MRQQIVCDSPCGGIVWKHHHHRMNAQLCVLSNSYVHDAVVDDFESFRGGGEIVVVTISAE